MREKHQKQMPLIDLPTGHPKEKELEAISIVLDSTPTICDHVLQDLNKGKIIKRRTGARGMTAEEIIRAAVVMRIYSFTDEDLAFHISDSRALRRFCRIGIADKGFKKVGPHRQYQTAVAANLAAYIRRPFGLRQGRKNRKGPEGADRLYGGRVQHP